MSIPNIAELGVALHAVNALRHLVPYSKAYLFAHIEMRARKDDCVSRTLKAANCTFSKEKHTGDNSAFHVYPVSVGQCFMRRMLFSLSVRIASINALSLPLSYYLRKENLGTKSWSTREDCVWL